ncbi:MULTISPECIES: membrane protein [Metallosphaera]|uniref:Membrane protein n=3 Tax=Metallosphaera TaxID=41980 RepID=A0A088E8N0_9CREN|nr:MULTISPECIES: membrane protein [Metallosphaera]ABP95671.1 putative membrane protein [Metallosphaera sedula DSM 5348]AIM27655.1 putative membrane protein [Metallosphaera sedula]AKV74512.1 membrane protein [Metallosphaera sedula]AKV76751.1 membrane protein [Metallosphaera sedula]AKV79002.1 membrane protein [Metallosphaera sedula]
MDIGVFLAALAMGTLELSEAGAVSAIYAGAYKSWIPYLYGALGVSVVLLPTFTLGKFIELLPIQYVLVVGAVILAYFGYRLIRSARRSFKGIRKHHEEKEGMGVVLVVAITEALEDALVALALIPQSYSSTLLGTGISAILVLGLTALLKNQIARIRLPHLKFVLSSLLFSLASLWILEVALDVTELVILPLFLLYLGVNYLIIKI